MGNIRELAINPLQYDSKDTGWESVGASAESPTRTHFWNYLKRYSSSWKENNVIDIGSGTGWLVDLVLKEGARSGVGIEPSRRNYELARSLYPHVNSLNVSLEDYIPDRKFDVGLAVMSFVHIGNLEEAFKKISGFLNPQGELIAIVPDYDYFHAPRNNYEVTFEEVDSDEYATLIKRPHGTLADIVRTTKKYSRVAEGYGISLLHDIPIPALQNTPAGEYTTENPSVIATHLLRFQKISEGISAFR